MTSKDKLIGTALILIGLAFIGLGVFVGMKSSAPTTNPGIYTEQNDTNNEIYQEPQVQVPVDIYSENVNEQTEEGGTRYIY